MKKIYLLVIVALSIFVCSGCSKFVCDDCGKEKVGKIHTIEVYGVRSELCGSCFSEYGKAGEWLEVE